MENQQILINEETIVEEKKSHTPTLVLMIIDIYVGCQQRTYGSINIL